MFQHFNRIEPPKRTSLQLRRVQRVARSCQIRKLVAWNTVDGRNPANHLGRCQNSANNGINYQPQLVTAGFLNRQ